MTRQDELRKMVAEATPGPWWSDESDPSDVVVWGKADELVANLGHRVQPVLVAFDVDASNGYLIAQAPTLATDLAAALDKIERLEGFIGDFAAAKIDALRYSPPHGASPEDEPDPVVDAETVWAWQADAKAALTTGEG